MRPKEESQVEQRKIYEDIALRTEGDIYIGVVGPVRTGKSTFIKRFMETMVIPNIDNVYRAGSGPGMSCPRAAPGAPS